MDLLGRKRECDGLVTGWLKNGQKMLDGNYQKRLMNGEWTYYHENGQFHAQGRFIDGDGGNPSEISGIPFNGRSGTWKFWYENGQKKREGTFKDGELNELWTVWYENGQKDYEITYMDGILISEKCWDEDGNEMDCPG